MSPCCYTTDTTEWNTNKDKGIPSLKTKKNYKALIIYKIMVIQSILLGTGQVHKAEKNKGVLWPHEFSFV